MEPRIQEKLDNFSGPIDVFSSDDLDASVSDLRPVAHLTGEDLSATLEAAIKSSLDKVQTESASRVVGFGQMLLGTLISVGIVMLLLSAMAYYVFTNTDLDFLKQLTAVPALVEPQVLGEDGNEVNEAVDQAPLKTTGGSSVTSPGAVKSSAPARNEAVVNDSVVPEDSLEPKVVDELVPERANPGAKLPAPVPEVKEVASPVPIVPSPPLVFGMLQVTSAEKGRAITIDGEPTQFTTPARFDWPVGTIEVRVEGYPVKEVVVRESQVNNVLFR
jgi:hypothetical protein